MQKKYLLALFIVGVFLFIITGVNSDSRDTAKVEVVASYDLSYLSPLDVYPYGISTNGTTSTPDTFWIADAYSNGIWELNGTFVNKSVIYDVLTEAGSNSIREIDANGTDYYFFDATDSFVYHFNSTYQNQTDGFSFGYTTLTRNDTNIFATVFANPNITVLDYSGVKQYDITCVTVSDCLYTRALTTIDGTSFWILNSNDETIKHIDSSGNTLSSRSLTNVGSGIVDEGSLNSITTSNGDDFWILDYSLDSVYHILYNSTQNITFSSPWNLSGVKYYENAIINITIDDNIAVDGYIASTNVSGSWTNFSGFVDVVDDVTYLASESFNVTKTRGTLISWKYYANDSDGNMAESSTYSFEVSNTAPTQDTPILNATTTNNKTIDDLNCYNQSTNDVDGDSPINVIKWYKDDVEQSSLENQSLILSGNTSVGENWICEVTPFDTFDYGTPQNSTGLTISSITSITYNYNSTYADVTMFAVQNNRIIDSPPAYFPDAWNDTLYPLSIYNIATDGCLETIDGDYCTVSSLQPTEHGGFVFWADLSAFNSSNIVSINWSYQINCVGTSNKQSKWVSNFTENNWTLNSADTCGAAGSNLTNYTYFTNINEAINQTSNLTYFVYQRNETGASGLNQRNIDFMQLTIEYSGSLQPIISILSPTNTTYNYNITYLNYTAIDTDPDTCWYSLDGGTTNTTIACGTNVDSITSNEGSNTWFAYMNDSEGNEDSSSVTFFVDGVYPLIETAYPENTTYNTNITEFNYTITELNPDTCWYSLDEGVTNTTITCGNNVTSITSNEGSNTWTIYINDTAGNENSSVVTFFVDGVYPLIDVTYPTNTTYNTIQTELNYTYTELNPDTCWYSLDGGTTNITITCGNNVTGLTSTQSSNTWSVYINDTAGNENSSSVTFFVDSISPLIDYVSPTENNNTNFSRNWIYVNVTVTETNEDTITFELYNSTGLVNSTSFTDSTREINFTGLADGSYEYNVTINDTLNNINFTETRLIRLDTTYPQLVLDYPTNTTYTSNQTQLNYTLTELNPDTCWYSLDEGINNVTIVCGSDVDSITSNEGSNTWIVYTNDTSGNENSSSVTFFVDGVQPATTLIFPANGYEDSDGNVNFSYSVTDVNNIANCSLVIGETIEQTNTTVTKSITQYFNVTGLTNGPKNWYINCTDDAGNVNKSETRTININIGTGGTGGGGGGTLPPPSTTGDETGTDLIPPEGEQPSEGATDSNNDGDYTDPQDDWDGDGIANIDDPTPWGELGEEYINFLTVGASSSGTPTIVEKEYISVLAIKQPTDVGNLSYLDRAKIFKVLFSFCGGSDLDEELVDCSLIQADLDEINRILREEYLIDIEPDETINWIRNYNNDEVEAVNVLLSEAEIWGLISRELTIIEPIFKVSPVFFDKFFLAFSNKFTGKVTSNKVLSSLEIVESDAGISAELKTITTAEVTYTLPSNYGIKFSTAEGKISYIDIDGNVVVQNIRIRVIPYQVVLIVLGIIGIVIFIFRKKIRIAFRKAFRKK